MCDEIPSFDIHESFGQKLVPTGSSCAIQDDKCVPFSSSQVIGGRARRGGGGICGVCGIRVVRVRVGVEVRGPMSDDSLFHTHRLAKTDSMASLALRYGVSVRDVKRANGGVISDATLHARVSVRIPRTALAEGAPLPGGGGLTGAVKPKTGSNALEEMRKYYGTSTSGAPGTDGPDKSAGTGPEMESTRAFSGGTQTANKVTRVGSGPLLASPLDETSRNDSTSENQRDPKTSHGGVSIWSFHGRDKALMSPPTTKTATGATVPAVQGIAGAGTGSSGSLNLGFFSRVKKFAVESNLAADVAALAVGAGWDPVVRNGARVTHKDATQRKTAQPPGSERKGKGD